MSALPLSQPDRHDRPDRPDHAVPYSVREARERARLAGQRSVAQRVLDDTQTPIDLGWFITSVLDGAIGDYDLPFESADDACLAIRYMLEQRGRRSLTAAETIRVDLAIVCEINQRHREARSEPDLDPVTMAERSGWLEDFHAGHHR